MTINECLIALERDRREPDKTLLNITSLRRALSDVRNIEGVTREVWDALYVDNSSRTTRPVRKVFDNVLWGGKDVGDNSQFWKEAEILREYKGRDNRLLADVRFLHDGRISHGHFVDVTMKGI